jgi:hypothetical protein
MKIILPFYIFIFLFKFSYSQVTYNWNSFTTGGFSYTNTQPVGCSMTTNITGSAIGDYNSSTGPRFDNAVTTSGVGLLLDQNWSNKTTVTQVQNTFLPALTNPSFRIFDINTTPNTSNFSTNSFVDSVFVSAVGATAVTAVNSIPSQTNIQIIGTTVKIVAIPLCGVTTLGNVLINFTGPVTQITIRYTSGNKLTYCSVFTSCGAVVGTPPCATLLNATNPTRQYITIGNISGTSVGCGILPISLLDFNVKCQSDKPLITWATATETNNNYFSVDRSIDGETYNSIATINSMGNSLNIQTYSYIDPNPLPGISYYRLSQTDLNGVTTSLSTKSYKKNCSDMPFNIVALSNPFDNVLSLNLNYNKDSQITLSIYDNLGQLVKTIFDNTIMDGNTSKITIDTENLATSIYYLRGFVNNEPFNLKLIKIK